MCLPMPWVDRGNLGGEGRTERTGIAFRSGAAVGRGANYGSHIRCGGGGGGGGAICTSPPSVCGAADRQASLAAGEAEGRRRTLRNAAVAAASTRTPALGRDHVRVRPLGRKTKTQLNSLSPLPLSFFSTSKTLFIGIGSGNGPGRNCIPIFMKRRNVAATLYSLSLSLSVCLSWSLRPRPPTGVRDVTLKLRRLPTHPPFFLSLFNSIW